MVSLMHMELPAELEQHRDEIQILQEQLQSRERTIRHTFQFQIEKYFADFKSTRRSRIGVSHSSDSVSRSVLTGQKASRIQATIESISQRHQEAHKNQLLNTARRLKTLVHRADETTDDNPISPVKLCSAFLASIETLNITNKKTQHLFSLLDHTLSNQLDHFYHQIDLGLYYLDILPGLSDPSIFTIPEETPPPAEIEASETDSAEVYIQTVRMQADELAAIACVDDSKLEQILADFTKATQNGTRQLQRLFSALKASIAAYIDEQQLVDLEKFSHFYSNLLDNTRLSAALKMQLSRLTGPLLPLILADSSFFSSNSHPVNDLLLSIVDYELRFKHQPEEIAHLSSAIDTLLCNSHPDISSFQSLILGYEALIIKELQRQQAIERARIEEQQIQQQMLEMVNELTAELVVSHEAMSFFYDDWQLFLFHVAQQAGSQSNEFKLAVDITKQLCWFLDEKKQDLHPDYEPLSFKSLLTEIEKGLIALSFSSEHRHRIRKLLIAEYKQNNQQSSFTIQSSSKSMLSGRLTGSVQSKVNTATQFNGELKLGSWVEIKHSSGKPYIRAKLKWKSPDNSLFIFIDQRGHKVLEINSLKLEQEFNNGNIRSLKGSSRTYHEVSFGTGLKP